MTTPSEGQHWTEAMPHLLDRAAELLEIDRATAARHSAVVPAGFHVWTPGRGGAQLVIGFDGGALVRESCFSQAEMVQSFMQNHRNGDTAAGRTMHAGSAVLVALDHLAQRAPRAISAQDPGEATLAAAGRGPFRQTTPEEITARLSASPVGTWTLLGIDRPHGPGHWYVVLVTPDGLTTIDPVANRTVAWPPVTEAVRWWTDGPPSTPPARVVVDVRTAAGRRVWTETAPALEPHARELLDWFAQQPTLRAGQGVWHSFWWAVVAAAGNDLRLAATDLTKPGIETLTWDVEEMLAYRAAEVRATNGVPREPIHFIDGVRWRPEVANAGRAVLRRRTVAEGDTGWLVTTRPDDDGADLPVVPAHEVHRQVPWVTPFLSHPVGTLLEVRADGSRHEVGAEKGAAGDTPAVPAPPAPSGQPAAPPAEPAAAPARVTPAVDHARTLLGDPAVTGEQLLAAAEAIQAAYERGEKRLGLLPPEAADTMLRTYLEADRRGSRRAALIWVRRAYLGAWDPAGPVVARVEQLVTDDPDGEAHLLRGWMRGQGYGYPQDWAAAATDHEVAAAAGNADALFELAVLSGTGRGRPKDEARAREYTDRAAAAGHPRALYNVGAELARGHGRPQDSAAALATYLRAVEKGHPRAAWTAGLMTLSGDGTQQNTARAGELLRQAQYLGLDVDALMTAMPTRVREMVQIAMGTAPERR